MLAHLLPPGTDIAGSVEVALILLLELIAKPREIAITRTLVVASPSVEFTLVDIIIVNRIRASAI
jgi:hypothetical protein